MFFLFVAFARADEFITANTTWDLSANPRVVAQPVHIQNGARLTLVPGLIVKFQSGVSLFVENGALIADSILFTSYLDDAGGDTNGDGAASSPAPGNWNVVSILSPGSDIRRCVFRYGGHGFGVVRLAASDVVFRGNLIDKNTPQGLTITDGAAPLIEGCTVQFTKNGPALRGSDLGMGAAVIRNNLFQNNPDNTAAIAVSGNVAEVSGNVIDRNRGEGIFFLGSGTPVVAGNRFSNNGGAAIYMRGLNVFPTGLDTNVIVSTGAIDAILIEGNTMTQSGTWSSTTLPYYLATSPTVAAGVTLTLAPGVVVKSGNADLVVNGTLQAVGTPSQSIVFTALADDSVGGNADVFQGDTGPTNWGQVLLNGPGSRVEGAVFRYGQANIAGSGIVFRGNRVENTSDGLRISNGGAPLVEGCTFQFLQRMGIRGNDLGMGAAVIRGNVVRNSVGDYAIAVTGDVAEITDNLLERGGGGISIGSPGTPLVSGNRIGGHTRAAIHLGSANIFPRSGAPNVIVSSSVIDGVEINSPMTMTASGTWSDLGLPYLINAGVVTVGAGATLTVSTGVVVKMSGNGGLAAQGKILAQGTPDKPIFFTSFRDDTVGGNSNALEGDALPAPGNWSSVKILQGGSRFRNCVFRYAAGVGDAALNVQADDVEVRSVLFERNTDALMIAAASASPLIEGCTFQFNQKRDVVAQSFGSPVVRGNNFSAGSQYAVFNAGPNVIDARSNYWGDASGPKDASDDRASGGFYNPGGLGGQVSDFVEYNPWIGLPPADNTPPFVSSATFNPAGPARLGPLSILGVYSEQMDNSVSPVVSITPFNSAVPVEVASATFENAAWTGTIEITTAMAGGMAALVFSGGRDLAGNLAAATTFQFLIDYTPPGPPANLSVKLEGNGTQATVSWTRGEENSTFSVFRSSTPSFDFAAPIKTGLAAPPYTDAPPAGGAFVYYAVAETDATGLIGAISTSTRAASPFTPSVSSPRDGDRVSVPQIAVIGKAQAGATVTLFTSTGGAIGSGVANGASSFAFTATLPEEGDTFVHARASDAESHISTPTVSIRVRLDLPPSQVSAFTADAADTVVTLHWTDVPDPDVRGYWLYRDGQNNSLNEFMIAPGFEQYRDIALTNGRSYGYQIAAEDNAGQKGPKSQSLSITPLAGIKW